MPDPQGYVPDKQTMQRIIRTVKAYEGNGDFGGGTSANRSPGNPFILAKLTSRDTFDGSLYAWSQVRRTDGDYEVIDPAKGGLAGTTTSFPAVDIRPETDQDDLTNQIVGMMRGYQQTTGEDGKTKTETVWWIVTLREGVGQYATQYHQVGSNNRGTWDMMRAGAIPVPPS